MSYFLVLKRKALRSLELHRFFRDVFREVAQGFPTVEADYAYVDAFCHSLVREPERYDVVVSPNFSGDVITDLAAALQGGMGMAASGNIGDDHAMFEPIHGSAPPLAGKDRANPAAAMLSCGLLLGWLGQRRNDGALSRAAVIVEDAVGGALGSGLAMTADLGGSVGTKVAADAKLKFE